MSDELVLIIILFVLVMFAIATAVLLLHQPVKEQFKYCYNCNYAMCSAVPKTKECLKYLKANEGKLKDQSEKVPAS